MQNLEYSADFENNTIGDEGFRNYSPRVFGT